MQVVILAGGSGTRLREMSEFQPKPLIPIGPYPMIVHIMKLYASYGYKDFVLALGFKQEAFKIYFHNYDIINHDITINTGSYAGMSYNNTTDKWKVILSDTGENTLKGGRLKRVEKYIEGDNFFCCYGDGIGNINLPELLEYHLAQGKIATVTGVYSPPRFGEITQNKGKVISFSEKPSNLTHIINGGFFVFNRKIFDYLSEDEWCDLEYGPLELIAAKDEMGMYLHKGYWGCMDTIKDVDVLQKEWDSGDPGWLKFV